MIRQILTYIGAFSPLYLFIISVILLRNYKIYLKYYGVGTIINTILNITLKLIIKEPRPNEDYKAITIGTANGYRFEPDMYGMPSGHAQNCAFNLAFIASIIKSSFITWLYIVITIVTLGQRYIYDYHTIVQLLVGLCIGLVIGTIFYKYANEKVKGHITEKPDDNGPL